MVFFRGVLVPAKSAAILLTAFLLLVVQGQAQTAPTLAGSPPPSLQPLGRPVIGVALEGGGALGLAHIGVLQWLEEHQIPVDRLSGTSMGALVGAFYAAGSTPAQLRALAESDAFSRVFTLQSPYDSLSFRRRQDRRELPYALTVGLRRGVNLRNALLADRAVNEFLSGNLSAYNSQELEYDRLPIPFRCVATDLNSLEPVIFTSGPLPQAVRASISIPGVFPPVKEPNGHYLVDGGILDNLPTDVLQRDLHAGVILAIHLEDPPLAKSDTDSIVGVLNRSFDAGIELNVARSMRQADVVVSVPTGGFSSTDYARAAQLIDLGYKAAEQSRAALLPYALEASAWQAYLAARNSRRRPPPGVLREIRVQGPKPASTHGQSPSADRQVLSDLKPLEGQPFEAAKTIEALRPIQSNGGISATWETFIPQPTPPSAPPASTESAPDAGLLVRLAKDRSGPPYLLISPELTAATSNISRGEATIRLIDQNLGGYGSELRATARLGYMTDLSAEYYRLLTSGGFFIQPRAGLLRAPVYLWVNQKRVAERFQQNLDAGIEAGRTFSNQLQISADWRAEDTRWSLISGAGGGPYLTGTAQTGLLRLRMDHASAGAISPYGFRLDAAAGALYHAVSSAIAPLTELSFSVSHSWKESNIIGLGGEINSYLRANVAQPYRFVLGGPMRLSASSIDEFRGTDFYLARAGYMHRLAALPTGLGQGLYGVLGYEAGEVWSPEMRAILRQDGILGLVANTPIGLFTFGISAGDAGHRKVFLTLGRWF